MTLKMQIRIQRRTEAVDKRHRTEPCTDWRVRTTGAERRFDLGEENPQYRIDQTGVVMEKIPQPLR